MNNLLFTIRRQEFAVFLCCATVVSLVFSRFGLTLCMIFFVAMSLFSWQKERKNPLRWNPDLRRTCHHFFHYPPYYLLLLFFLLVLVSGLWSESLPFWSERLRIRLPFLFLPFAFAALPRFSGKQFLGILFFFLLVISLTTVGILINYAAHYQEITALVWHGQPLPMPANHVRFSLFLAFASAIGTVLYYKNFYIKNIFERKIIASLTLFCIVGLHLLSVRSGLVVLYAEFFLLAMFYAIHSGRWVAALSFVAFLSIVPVVAYFAVPAFEARVEYMRLDAEQYKAGTGSNYSDSERLTSIVTGIKVGNQNPVFGVGMGDLMIEMKKIYHRDYPGFSDFKIPHNEWVMTYASTGGAGLILFGIAFFVPFFYQKNYKNVLFSCFYLLIFLSFMVEATIETAVGTAFYVFFLLLGLHYLKNEPPPTAIADSASANN